MVTGAPSAKAAIPLKFLTRNKAQSSMEYRQCTWVTTRLGNQSGYINNTFRQTNHGHRLHVRVDKLGSSRVGSGLVVVQPIKLRAIGARSPNQPKQLNGLWWFAHRAPLPFQRARKRPV